MGKRDDAIDGSLLLPGWRSTADPLAPDVMRRADDDAWREFSRLGFAWDEETRRRAWLPSRHCATLRQRTPSAALWLWRAPRVGHQQEPGRVAKRNAAAGPHAAVPANSAGDALDQIGQARAAGTGPALTDRLIDLLVQGSGLPPSCPLNDEYRSLLRLCNSVRIYEIRGSMGVRQKVIAAFVCPFRFGFSNGITLVPLDAESFGTVLRTLTEAAALVMPGTSTYVALGATAAGESVTGIESALGFSMVCIPSHLSSVNPRQAAPAGIGFRRVGHASSAARGPSPRVH